MIVEQTVIYDYLGAKQDPIYIELIALNNGGQIKIGDTTIALNKIGLYEVTSKNTHDGFSNIMSCYSCICSLLNNNLEVM